MVEMFMLSEYYFQFPWNFNLIHLDLSCLQKQHFYYPQGRILLNHCSMEIRPYDYIIALIFYCHRHMLESEVPSLPELETIETALFLKEELLLKVSESFIWWYLLRVSLTFNVRKFYVCVLIQVVILHSFSSLLDW